MRKTKKEMLIDEQARLWKKFRPDLNKKTFFKGLESLTVGMQSSLDLKDNAARKIVKEAFELAGHKLP